MTIRLRCGPAVLLAASVACAPARPAQQTTAMNDRDSAHLNAMSREHAGQTPAENASAMAPRTPVTAEEVEYGRGPDGRAIRGYRARPRNAGTGAALPGLLVIHEWWGLNDNIRMMARRLAGEGYDVLAVDLYGGAAASTAEEARALMQAATRDRAAGQRNLAAAAAYLRAAGAPKLGVIGWCFGGGWSLQTALALPEQIDAAVVYYGQPELDRTALARLDAPLLGFFGGADTGIPVAQVRQMETMLREMGKPVEFRIYPGAKHAFANPSGPSYDPTAAADAWQRTLAFLARTLQPAAPSAS